MERVDFAFFVDIKYEKILDFCSFYNCIGHSITNYKRKEHDSGKGVDPLQKKDKSVYIPSGRRIIVGESSKVNLVNQHTEVNTWEGTGPAKGNRVVPDVYTIEVTNKAGGNVHKNVIKDNNDVIDAAIFIPNGAAILIPNEAAMLVPNPNSSIMDKSLEVADSFESELIEVTQMVDYVLETQLDERYKNQVT